MFNEARVAGGRVGVQYAARLQRPEGEREKKGHSATSPLSVIDKFILTIVEKHLKKVKYDSET